MLPDDDATPRQRDRSTKLHVTPSAVNVRFSAASDGPADVQLEPVEGCNVEMSVRNRVLRVLRVHLKVFQLAISAAADDGRAALQ